MKKSLLLSVPVLCALLVGCQPSAPAVVGKWTLAEPLTEGQMMITGGTVEYTADKKMTSELSVNAGLQALKMKVVADYELNGTQLRQIPKEVYMNDVKLPANSPVLAAMSDPERNTVTVEFINNDQVKMIGVSTTSIWNRMK